MIFKILVGKRSRLCPVTSISASSFFESTTPRYSASDQPEKACLQFNRVMNAQRWGGGRRRTVLHKGANLQGGLYKYRRQGACPALVAALGSVFFCLLRTSNLIPQHEGAKPCSRLLRGGVLPVRTQPGHRAGPQQGPGSGGAAEPPGRHEPLLFASAGTGTRSPARHSA